MPDANPPPNSILEAAICPLCGVAGPFSVWSHRAWRDREFCLCGVCDLVFVPSEMQLTPGKERERYERHQNDAGDTGFREFLWPTVMALRNWKEAREFGSEGANLRLGAGGIFEAATESRGSPQVVAPRLLDFGAGPSPVLADLLALEGFDVVAYDPFFAPVEPTGIFDLVVLHEVFEHLREPARELARLEKLLAPHGSLWIRSELRPPTAEEFANWWYARDATHVIFPSEKTWDWLASQRNWEWFAEGPQLWSFSRNTSGSVTTLSSSNKG